MEKRGAILLILLLSLSLVASEKLDVEIGNAYSPGDEIEFRILLFDDANNRKPGNVGYQVVDYYTDVISEGSVESGERVVFKLPENAIRGHWGIIATYEDVEKRELFEVGESELASIVLEIDELVITNIGNVPYRKQISISIGGQQETALVPLALGQTKRIRLTAPDGEYEVRVSDGTEDNDLVFNGVSLTGNVIGLEREEASGFGRYNLVILFLTVLGLVVVIVFGLKAYRKLGN